MSLSHPLRLIAAAAVVVALTVGTASAGPGGGHGGGGHAGGGAHMGGAHVGGVHMGGAHAGGVYHAPSNSGFYRSSGYYPYRSNVFIGLGYGLGGYGLGYGLGYGGLGYGYGGYGYGGGYYGGNYGGSSLYGYPGGYASLDVPAVPGTYYPQTQSLPPIQMIDPGTDPAPLPLPNAAKGEPAAAKITVITNEGAKVTFEGIESDQGGTRHSFTTKPLPQGVEARVKVQVDGSSISIGVKAGEKATVDMRK